MAGTENVRIKSIPNKTTVELYEPTVYTHKASDEAMLKSMLSKSIGPNQLVYESGIWRIYGSAWGVISDYTYENTTYAEGKDLNAVQWIYKKMPTVNYDTVITSAWDSSS